MRIITIFFRHGFRNSFSTLYLTFIRNIDGPLGDTLRYHYYKNKLAFLGENARIDTGVFIYNPQFVEIGNDTHIDKNCMLIGSSENLDLSCRILLNKEDPDIMIRKGRLVIGNMCHISQNVMLFAYYGIKIGDKCTLSTGSKIYSLSSLPHNPFDETEIVSIQPYTSRSPTVTGAVELEDNVWLGINVVVNPCVKIRKDSFVRSNSIVMSSFQSNSYISGDPAVLLKRRYNI